MKYTYKNILLINFPVMMSILIEQLINITDAIFLGHVGEIELGASALAGGEQHYSETGKTFFQAAFVPGRHYPH